MVVQLLRCVRRRSAMLDYLTQHFYTRAYKSGLQTQNCPRASLQSFKQELSDFINVKLLPFSSESGEGVGELREILDSVTQDN